MWAFYSVPNCLGVPGATQAGPALSLITNSDQGMVDIHDRRPVVMSSECVANWITRSSGQRRRKNL